MKNITREHLPDFQILVKAICSAMPKLQEQDFQTMFQNARIGWRYIWGKYFRKNPGDRDFGDLYMNIDRDYQMMVVYHFMQEDNREDPLLYLHLLRGWFLFAYNFSQEFWDEVFPAEQEKYISMCGKPKQGLLDYITVPMICGLFLKISPQQQLRMLEHAFFSYQDINEKVLQAEKWEGVIEAAVEKRQREAQEKGEVV